MDNIEQRVKEIIVDCLGVDIKEVIPQASLMKDLGADSLDMVELTMALEEEFAVEIPDDDADKILTVGQVIEYIKSRQGKN